MSKHTPGPWFADDTGVGGISTHAHWLGVGPQGDALGRGFDVAIVEKKEDASLISAAPDLLAACDCKTCGGSGFVLWVSGRIEPCPDECGNKRRAAIAKARGK